MADPIDEEMAETMAEIAVENLPAWLTERQRETVAAIKPFAYLSDVTRHDDGARCTFGDAEGYIGTWPIIIRPDGSVRRG